MPFDRAGDRRVAGISLAALLSLTPAVALRRVQRHHPAIDAEVLRDLDVLDNPNYARDREIAKRLTFYERMRMLDRWLSNRPAPDGAPAPAEPAKREVR